MEKKLTPEEQADVEQLKKVMACNHDQIQRELVRLPMGGEFRFIRCLDCKTSLIPMEMYQLMESFRLKQAKKVAR